MDSLLQLSILFFFVTLKFNNNQLEGVYFIVSLGVCMISAYTLDSFIAKGKVFINTEGISKK